MHWPTKLSQLIAAGGASLRSIPAAWVRASARLAFPPVCTICRRDCEDDAGIRLCQPCRAEIVAANVACCPRCGDRAKSSAARGPRCASCRRYHYQFARVIFLGQYDGRLREAVLGAKRAANEPLARALAQLSVQTLRARIERVQPDVVAPIPMHWRRRMARGVNNPEIAAAQWARALNIPLAQRLLVRRRYTPPQSDLTPTERFENIRDAFRLGRGQRLHDAHVLLVDDVLTSGATCHEAARLLRQHGAREVSVVIHARTAEG